MPLFSTTISPHLQSLSLRDSQDLLSRRNSLPDQSRPVTLHEAAASGEVSPITGHDLQNVDIGRAIISGANTPRRRSHSVSDLRDTAAILYTFRQLEDEKDYWRQSYADNMIGRAQTEGSQEAESFKDSYAHQPLEALAALEESLSDLHDDEDQDNLDQDTRRYAVAVAAEEEGEARLQEQQQRLLTAHDSPVMGPRHTDDNFTDSMQVRLVKLEQMMSAFQQPLESLARNKRKSVTFDTTDSRRSSHNPMPDDSRLVLYLQLLEDERAKRRSLERQVRELREDLAEMRFQLSQPIMSRHCRVYTPGPTRHRYTPHHSRDGSSYSAYDQQRLASRFSRSESLTESEAARMHKDLEDTQSQRDVADLATSAPPTPFEISTDPVKRWTPRESEALEMF